jgi:hypothetical protein
MTYAPKDGEQMMATATVCGCISTGSRSMPERLFTALDAAGLITGAFRGVPYADLPEPARKALGDAVEMVEDDARERYADNYDDRNWDY